MLSFMTIVYVRVLSRQHKSGATLGAVRVVCVALRDRGYGVRSTRVRHTSTLRETCERAAEFAHHKQSTLTVSQGAGHW